MNTHESHLLAQLLHSGQSRGRHRPLRRTACEFVLEYGWWYTPALLPDPLTHGRDSECFKNAFFLALDQSELVYVEGYAIRDSGTRVHHAWLTDRQGNALDNTWPESGVAYAGVPFRIDFVNRSHIKNRLLVCLIDDYVHDWPLLRELGDKPDEWLDSHGRGREKILIPW
jgi:hypothetical protein